METGAEQQRNIRVVIDDERRARLLAEASYLAGLLEQDPRPVAFVPDLQNLRAGVQHRPGGGFELALPRCKKTGIEDGI